MSNSKATVLLGTHFSGKSTFFKHIKFLRLNQNIEDKELLSNQIKDNCKHKIEGFLLFIKEKGNELNLTTDIEKKKQKQKNNTINNENQRESKFQENENNSQNRHFESSQTHHQKKKR
ncbi:guanine nucleotide-binding protein alpha-6 subunit-related [Anaeramoeba flamelloides]|uniref:Guanine nucleotide-binding protein alpha-6 subunit-related n=1 Tax=Anaeramoeba flamelloides TaxID=1746091 RepID=A0AAV7Z812_9EUKA|nr:guanine nucleotide-binding protein alpha-6 subunit-related [Anaeramoeba flamelloides]